MHRVPILRRFSTKNAKNTVVDAIELLGFTIAMRLICVRYVQSYAKYLNHGSLKLAGEARIPIKDGCYLQLVLMKLTINR